MAGVIDMPSALVLVTVGAGVITAMIKFMPHREPRRESRWESSNGKYVLEGHCELQHKNLDGWMGRLEKDLHEVKDDVKQLLQRGN